MNVQTNAHFMKGDKMRIGLLKYHCEKCGKKVLISCFPDRNDETNEYIRQLFDNKRCVDCGKKNED